MKSSLLVGIVATSLAVGFALSGHAQTVTNNFNFTIGQTVPDNDLTGLADTRSISSPILSLTDIQVTLNISGGYNGDLYAYLTHDTGFSVLLNRAGKTAGDPFGYGDSGFNVTFDDSAINGDIHSYQITLNPGGGILTGIWQPDARNIHPDNALDTTPRTADLSSFNGLNPNGNWTLFIADVSAVGESHLNGWGMQQIGVVPEPSTYALMSLGLGLIAWKLRRRRNRSK